MIQNPIKAWMSNATTGEQIKLAKAAKTSRGHLYHLSSGARTAGADLAKRLEIASTVLRNANKKLPLLKRTELCPACGSCEYAKRCSK